VGSNYGATKMSLDGRTALTPGDYGTAWVWNAATGEKLRTLPARDGGGDVVFSMLSSNGRRFATFYANGPFCVWEERRAEPVMCGKGPPSVDVDFSRDGRRALKAADNGVVEVWDVRPGGNKPVARLRTGAKLISAQFDRRGENLVAALANGTAQVWHVSPKRQLATLRRHTRGVERARFSPDGALVATVAEDGSARLWPSRPRMPENPEWWSADSTTFAPGSRDVLLVRGTQRAVWNIEEGTTVDLDDGGVAMPTSPDWPCGRAAGCSPWSRDGNAVAGVTEKGAAVLWDVRTGEVRKHYGEPSVTNVEAALSPGGRLVVVVDAERSPVRIWRRATEQPTSEIPGAARASLFVPSPLRVLTVAADGKAHVTAPGRANVTVANATSPPAVAATRDGQIAVGTQSGELRVVSGGATRTRRANEGPVSAIGFNPAGTSIVTGAQFGTVRTWDAVTLTSTLLTTTEFSVTGVGLSRGADLVLVSAGSGATLWDRTVGQPVVELPQTPDARAEFSPDGKWIALAGGTGLEVVQCYACMSTRSLEQRARALLPAS